MKSQRQYDVRFSTLKSGETRTVRVSTTDGINAARLVYMSFGGRKKIIVLSAEVVKDDE